MTTIAYRDGLLAADTTMCQGGVTMGRVQKIAPRADDDICGSAGDAAYNPAFTAWFLAGELIRSPILEQRSGRQRLTVWLQVRVLPGPPIISGS